MRAPGGGSSADRPVAALLVEQTHRAVGHAYYACQSELDMALCTCGEGHTTRLSGRVHQVAADGTVTPSYVCPVKGCTFHEWARLVGWDPAHVFAEVDVDAGD